MAAMFRPLLATALALASLPALAQPAPLMGAQLAISLPDQSGRLVSLSAYRGKVVLLTISGSWCGTCHHEAGFLVPWAARRKADGVEVISLQFEYPDDPAHARLRIAAYANRLGISWPLLLAGRPSRRDIAAALGGRGDIHQLPSHILIGRDGRVAHVQGSLADEATGEVSPAAIAMLDAQVNALLARR
jgi:peroxiredoxin